MIRLLWPCLGQLLPQDVEKYLPDIADGKQLLLTPLTSCPKQSINSLVQTNRGREIKIYQEMTMWIRSAAGRKEILDVAFLKGENFSNALEMQRICQNCWERQDSNWILTEIPLLGSHLLDVLFALNINILTEIGLLL